MLPMNRTWTGFAHFIYYIEAPLPATVWNPLHWPNLRGILVSNPFFTCCWLSMLTVSVFMLGGIYAPNLVVLMLRILVKYCDDLWWSRMERSECRSSWRSQPLMPSNSPGPSTDSITISRLQLLVVSYRDFRAHGDSLKGEIQMLKTHARWQRPTKTGPIHLPRRLGPYTYWAILANNSTPWVNLKEPRI